VFPSLLDDDDDDDDEGLQFFVWPSDVRCNRMPFDHQNLFSRRQRFQQEGDSLETKYNQNLFGLSVSPVHKLICRPLMLVWTKFGRKDYVQWF
jgi:hypothetical protein